MSEERDITGTLRRVQYSNLTNPIEVLLHNQLVFSGNSFDSILTLLTLLIEITFYATLQDISELAMLQILYHVTLDTLEGQVSRAISCQFSL